MQNIHQQAVLDAHLLQLVSHDPRLEAVRQVAGPLHPRMHPSGFEGLARVICGQQLSVASAGAIWQRFSERGDAARDPQAYLSRYETGLEGVGLSRSKILTLQRVAQALGQGQLDLDAVVGLPVAQAIAALTQYKGIGPWTAEIYLMFCAGHPDVFPVGDLALQKSVSQALGLEPGIKPAALAQVASAWAPWRSAAALLFWRYYGVQNRKDALPV
ncbi:DNA-3-methyladenine glycosylase 2 family protein [Castellaniella sp.]|uniref:DNA-3-methyladenine glycosylase family protein n=1 Tax=Castellaniella sp. TaxID=1955812 RepID=UPI002AFF2226|nr:DNA-3-methyladenine glycosylase 2 family protein [Castellaniella sp.]